MTESTIEAHPPVVNQPERDQQSPNSKPGSLSRRDFLAAATGFIAGSILSKTPEKILGSLDNPAAQLTLEQRQELRKTIGEEIDERVNGVLAVLNKAWGNQDPASARVDYYQALVLAKNVWGLTREMNELFPYKKQDQADRAHTLEGEIIDHDKMQRGLAIFGATIEELKRVNLPIPRSLRLPEPAAQEFAKLGSEAIKNLFDRPSDK